MSRHRKTSRLDRLVLPLFAAVVLLVVGGAIGAVAFRVNDPTPTAQEVTAIRVQDSALEYETTAPSTPAPMTAPTPVSVPTTPATPPAVPADSGSGRRVVFDQSDQRVWLIEADGSVNSSYLVSGSRYNNLSPGTYSISSRTLEAVSFDYSSTMSYFLEFTKGSNAPIGFHSIPVDMNGNLEQSLDELGQPLSAGCIRQAESDAAHLWEWAPNGTTVVVVA